MSASGLGGATAEPVQEAVERLARECGFESVGGCAAGGLSVREEVRAMCSSGSCGAYGTSWACPPACGELSFFAGQLRAYERCLVVQTVASLEDDFDFETMERAGALHKRRMLEVAEALAAQGLAGRTMTLSAGSCTICAVCAYPDAPCRFPGRRLVSMEAAGLVVAEVCALARVPYNHGRRTMAYSGCVLC